MYAINLNPISTQPGLSNTRDSSAFHSQTSLYPSPPPSSEGFPASSTSSQFALDPVHLDSSESTSHFGVGRQRQRSVSSAYPAEVDPPFMVPSSSYLPSPSTPKKSYKAESSRFKKPRREKPRIALAPDQPPTTQGKPRARVYVACLQCRTRKVRCDGAKPICHSCGQRGDHECTYDAVPKRRGPDKVPGARQRSVRDSGHLEGDTTTRRRRPRPSSSSPVEHPSAHYPSTLENRAFPPLSVPESSLSPESSDQFSSPVDYIPSSHVLLSNSNTSYIEECPCHGLRQCPDSTSTLLYTSVTSPKDVDYQPFNDSLNLSAPQSYITEVDEAGNEQSQEIGSQPSLNFTRKVWWDSLLSLYSAPSSDHVQPLTSLERHATSKNITSDIRFLFRTSNYWFCFFHVPTFFASYHDPVRREQMQPSLVLAALALSTFFQSSESDQGKFGRDRALRFRDEAQGALEASFNAGWVDETLAQAAWLLAVFEVCAHPLHSTKRSVSAIMMLDAIIRGMSLTFVDVDDPEASTFQPRSVPAVVGSSSKFGGWTSSHVDDISSSIGSYSSSQSAIETGCSCASLTLGEHWPAAHEHTPMWRATPAWNANWSEAEIRKESCRRLCWSAMTLAAGHVSYATAQRSGPPQLWISDPANYALLFSGESITRSPSLGGHGSSKDTIWALYDRCFLLWHSCVKMREDSSILDADKAQFAVKAWLEADAIESALNRHTCDIERNFIFQGREYIFKMCITYEFRRFVPLVPVELNGPIHRIKAAEWLSHQAVVAERFMQGLHTVTGNSNNTLARRPFFVFWFMGQVARALSLWQCDNTMTVALNVCKAFLPAIEYLSNLWPCQEQRCRYEKLWERLNNACYLAGLSSPPAPKYLTSSL